MTLRAACWGYSSILFIYLFIRQLPKSCHCRSSRINSKEREKKRKLIEARRVKHPTPSRATDAFIGDEERNGSPAGTISLEC